MTGPKLAQRVESLEDLMAALVRSSERAERQIEKTERQAEKTERQAEKTERQIERTSQELSEFKAESRAARIDMNRKWGELANRLGTMAEDLVAPSVPRVLREVLGLSDTPIDSAVRVRRHSSADPSVEREFDVVATCGDYLLINETKSRLAAEDVARFVEVLTTVRDFLPEHAAKRVIGAIASLYVDAAVVRRGEALGLIVLGFGEDVMEVLNAPGFVPRTF